MIERSVFNLSPAEKLQLVQDLWDDLASNPADVPLHDWQKEELERRHQNIAKYGVSSESWDELKQRIRTRHAE